MDSKEIVVICPRVEAEVELREGRFHLLTKIHGDPKEEKCEVDTKAFYELVRVEGIKHIYCSKCYGNGHVETYKISHIKHPLHPKHTLMFVRCDYAWRRKCLCCEFPLGDLFYCCLSCDFCINLACVKKQPLNIIDHPRRHEHALTLFPRQVTTNCNVCGLDDSRLSSIYICPCDFVVHKRCIYLPWSIRISRHPQHRLSFTTSFDLGNWICNICRRKINNEYGGYICNKEGCSYVAHSRCATGKNVWDGEELEGVSEEVGEEEVKPFESLGDGIIRHFSHKHHPLKLIEETTYDEYRSCEACVMPIYYGNFYSCMECSFILHETCANLSKRIYHAIHPHPLFLRVKSVTRLPCSACFGVCSAFFYECGRKNCYFRLHIQCATTYEPLIHNSHMHPLYLTSAPEECRSCSICKDTGLDHAITNETFNCIECGCDFSLCFNCAVLPQKVRYKHDKHILTLFYGEETTIEIENWCELCETKIKPGERFYTCDDYCCVTLHTKCLLGRDMNYKFGTYSNCQVDIMPNNRMTRPVCCTCQKRCNQKLVFKRYGLVYCCWKCMPMSIVDIMRFQSGL